MIEVSPFKSCYFHYTFTGLKKYESSYYGIFKIENNFSDIADIRYLSYLEIWKS